MKRLSKKYRLKVTAAKQSCYNYTWWRFFFFLRKPAVLTGTYRQNKIQWVFFLHRVSNHVALQQTLISCTSEERILNSAYSANFSFCTSPFATHSCQTQRFPFSSGIPGPKITVWSLGVCNACSSPVLLNSFFYLMKKFFEVICHRYIFIIVI